MIGSSYALAATSVDAEITMNWYQDFPESPGAKTQSWLSPTPGKSVYCTLSGSSVRGEIQFQGLLFAVSGANFYQIKDNGNGTGTRTLLGTVLSDNNPVSMTAGPGQILFASGGTMYVWQSASQPLPCLWCRKARLRQTTPSSARSRTLTAFFSAHLRIGQYQVLNPDDAPHGRCSLPRLFLSFQRISSAWRPATDRLLQWAKAIGFEL